MRKLLVTILILFCNLAVASDFMPAWQAFKVKLEQESTNNVWVKFDIASDYHIYQDRIKIEALPSSSVKLGQPLWPDPIEISAPDVGKFKVYEGNIAIQVPITKVGNGNLDISVRYQGCKSVELCYPEQKITEHIDLFHPNQTSPAGETVTPILDKSGSTKQATAGLVELTDLASSANTQQISQFFNQSSWLVISGFFIIGLLLAFTPCVFPMLPVLIGVIAGSQVTLRRSFILALSYILGGATLYAIAGVIAASLGYSLASSLQSIWLNYFIALLFVVFGLSLFGFFELRLPLSLQNKLNQTMGKFEKRSVLSAFIIGGLANLVLSPCVTGPLAGALVYISTTGNKLLGASALFALGLGSGVPLLLIAVFGKGLLPKTGNWLYLVKQLLALLMLLMAIYMLSKVVSIFDLTWLVAIWVLTLTWFAIDWFGLANYRKLIVFLVSFGILALVFDHNNKLILSNQEISTSQPNTVKSESQLQQALAKARAQGKDIILDYYADWCVACKEMDLKTFSNPKVKELLKNYSLIRVDISANNDASLSLQRRYNVIAPPSLIFIDKDGSPLDQYKTVGFIDSDKLAQELQRAISSNQ